MKRAKRLWRALGDEIRRRREARGGSQDEVATSARRWGLGWTRSVVAAIEAGRRRLTLEEFLLLPWIVANQSPADVKGAAVPDGTLGELLDALGGSVLLSPTVLVSGRGLRLLIEGQPGPAAQTLEDVAKRRFFDAEWERLRQTLGPSESGERAGTWPAIAENMLRLAAQGEAEQRAATRLGISPMAIVREAVKRWGRSLTAERDRRVSEMQAADATPRTVQALRGHIARALLAELRQAGTKRVQRRRVATQRGQGTRERRRRR